MLANTLSCPVPAPPLSKITDASDKLRTTKTRISLKIPEIDRALLLHLHATGSNAVL